MKEYSQEAVNAEIKMALEKMKTPNILICGQTGAGKSSAVNHLFNDEVAEIGHKGESCTMDIHLHRGTNLNIYDSEGYEIGGEKQQRYQNLIFDDFLMKPENQNIEGVHLVWYAIPAAGKRYTDTDIGLIKKISETHKVCILLTKIDELDEEELKQIHAGLKREFSTIQIFRLSIIKEEAVQAYCDWEDLVDWSYNALPDVCRDRFTSALRRGLAEKQKRARIAVAIATSAAAAIGALPIPIADAGLLFVNQSIMIFRIVYLYRIKVGIGSILSILGTAGVSAFGKLLAGTLLKLIPGKGSVAGGIINATVASTITAAMGVTLSKLCYKQCCEMLDGKEVGFDVQQIFSSAEFISAIKECMNDSSFESTVEELKKEGKERG